MSTQGEGSWGWGWGEGEVTQGPVFMMGLCKWSQIVRPKQVLWVPWPRTNVYPKGHLHPHSFIGIHQSCLTMELPTGSIFCCDWKGSIKTLKKVPAAKWIFFFAPRKSPGITYFKPPKGFISLLLICLSNPPLYGHISLICLHLLGVRFWNKKGILCGEVLSAWLNLPNSLCQNTRVNKCLFRMQATSISLCAFL